ncbi:MAG: hypothetical protein WKF30_05965 [Pyrinomonadaceae bacterium]
MQDRLHQAHRQSMVPGLADALATPRLPGLLGVALSGAGPSVIALARDRHREIGARISESFAAHGVRATVRVLEADTGGRILGKSNPLCDSLCLLSVILSFSSVSPKRD